MSLQVLVVPINCDVNLLSENCSLACLYILNNVEIVILLFRFLHCWDFKHSFYSLDLLLQLLDSSIQLYYSAFPIRYHTKLLLFFLLLLCPLLPLFIR